MVEHIEKQIWEEIQNFYRENCSYPHHVTLGREEMNALDMYVSSSFNNGIFTAMDLTPHGKVFMGVPVRECKSRRFLRAYPERRLTKIACENGTVKKFYEVIDNKCFQVRSVLGNLTN